MQLEAVRGDTFILNLTVKDSNGNPVNLTGAKMWMTAKRSYADDDSRAVFQVSSDAGDITYPKPTLGEAIITVLPAKTKDVVIEPSKVSQGLDLVFDVQLKTTAGVVATLLRGVFMLYADVTRTV